MPEPIRRSKSKTPKVEEPLADRQEENQLLHYQRMSICDLDYYLEILGRSGRQRGCKKCWLGGETVSFPASGR